MKDFLRNLLKKIPLKVPTRSLEMIAHLKKRVRPILSLFACNTLYVLSIKSGITLAVPNYNNSNVLSRSSSAKFC